MCATPLKKRKAETSLIKKLKPSAFGIQNEFMKDAAQDKDARMPKEKISVSALITGRKRAFCSVMNAESILKIIFEKGEKLCVTQKQKQKRPFLHIRI